MSLKYEPSSEPLHISDPYHHQVKNFRQHHSMTPGHPEFPNSEHNTPGIEATTGPLGQGNPPPLTPDHQPQ